MKGIVWYGPEQMSVDQVPEPSVEPGTVVVPPTATGICGSEIEGYLGKMGNRTPPLVMGHEFAGTVTQVGEGVDEGLVGRLVAVNPLSSDGTCPLCRAGLTNLCPNRKLVGIHSPGGFAEYTLAPASNVYPLPEGVEARTGALAEPLANGVHAARLGLAGRSVEHAVVVGAGTIGLMCLQAAALDGVPEVQALELLRPGGRAVYIGLHDDQTTLGYHDVVRGQLDLQGSYAYTAEDYEQALDWLVDGRAGIGELPPVLPLEEGPGAFAELVRGPSEQIKVFLAEAE